MATPKASAVFVECLEAEGVRYVFGIPGEETLDLNESIEDSSVQFVPVRHEQGGAYMADVYGRLTGRAGVCLGTLGPGATNLVTAVADAYLDRAPLVALTGQSDLERMHKESHQYIDLMRVMRPITKWNAQLTDPNIIPEVVRKAFKIAESEKPGATHIELPEDVMAQPLDAQPLPRMEVARPEPNARAMRLTAQGQILLDYAQRAFDLLAEGESMATAHHGTLVGALRVAAPSDLARWSPISKAATMPAALSAKGVAGAECGAPASCGRAAGAGRFADGSSVRYTASRTCRRARSRHTRTSSGCAWPVFSGAACGVAART